MDNTKTISNTIDIKRVYCDESICIVEYTNNKTHSSDTLLLEEDGNPYVKTVKSDSDVYKDVIKIYNKLK